MTASGPIIPANPSAPRRSWFDRRQIVQAAWMLMDALMMVAAMATTSALMGREPPSEYLSILALIIAARALAFYWLGLYHSVLRYSGIHTVLVTVAGIGIGSAVGITVSIFSDIHTPVVAQLGRVFMVMEGLLSLVACGGSRLLVRMVFERQGGGDAQRVLIYGAGSFGELVLRDLRRLGGYTPIGFLDDDAKKRGTLIHGRRVFGGLAELNAIVERRHPDLVIIAISDLQPATARTLFQACMARKVRVLVMGGVGSALGTQGGINLRELALEDLLSRPSRSLDASPVMRMLKGRSVLVTGAGGSIGSELCRQIAGMEVSKLVIVDHGELNLYTIDSALRDRFPNLTVVPVLCNLQHRPTLDQLFAAHRPEVVFHAAAYKHVPLVEENPFLGFENNVGGFRNLLEAADAAGVERLVLISSDKAVRPTNVMGASKRACELLLQNYPTRATKLCAVRFGNVLGSSGSVVPRFLDQISRGGPVTVTHPDMTRYFMLISEAVALVLQAGAMAEQGEIFILDMGEPVKIADMARQLIFMSGRRPDEDIRIVFSGLRPGEKLFEELWIQDSERGTAIDGISVSKVIRVPYDELKGRVERVLIACSTRDRDRFTAGLCELVPEWSPSGGLSSRVAVTTIGSV